MAKKPAPPPVQYGLSDAIDQADSIASELRDELQEWHDNLPEAFQNGSKGDALQEAIGYLDEVADQPVDVPSCLEEADEPPTFSFSPSNKPRMSRRDRGAEATELLRGAADAARSWASERREAGEAIEAALEAGEVAEAEADEKRQLAERMGAEADEADAFADEVEGQADALDSVEYPGMFG
jgi:hypothetical protein